MNYDRIDIIIAYSVFCILTGMEGLFIKNGKSELLLNR